MTQISSPNSIDSSDSGINSTFSASFAKTDSANSTWVMLKKLPGYPIGQNDYYF